MAFKLKKLKLMYTTTIFQTNNIVKPPVWHSSTAHLRSRLTTLPSSKPEYLAWLIPFLFTTTPFSTSNSSENVHMSFVLALEEPSELKTTVSSRLGNLNLPRLHQPGSFHMELSSQDKLFNLQMIESLDTLLTQFFNARILWAVEGRRTW
jgi:hypothetical protein